MSQSKLFVGNLPFSTTDQDLGELFAGVGNVLKATVMRDKDTGRARGFGFVEMSCDEDAQEAITQLHDTTVGGRRITVNIARTRENRNGGGNGHSYSGGRGREPRW